MAGRFPLYTDADVHGPLIDALRARGWDLLRAIDLYPQKTADAVHFERAAKENRVFVSNDQAMETIANRWLAEGRPFRGLILWPQVLQAHGLRRARGADRGALRALPPSGHPHHARAVEWAS